MVEVEEPIFLQKVLVYETGVLGSVTGLYAANHYSGNATDWQVLWEGIASEEDYADGVFQPPICPSVTMAAKYVKIVLDTDLSSAFISLDTLGFEGSIAPPDNVVWDAEQRLFYEPLGGVHFSNGPYFQDHIHVRASNCKSSSQILAIPLVGQLEGPMPSSMFGRVQEVSAVTGVQNLVQINLDDALEHLSSALGEKVSRSEFAVEVRPLGDSDLTQLFHDNGTPLFPPSSTAERPDGILLNNATLIVKPGSRQFKSMNLPVWLHCRNVTYRTALRIVEVCPDAVSVFECSPSALLCVDACDRDPLPCQRAAQDSGSGGRVLTTHNSAEGRCEVLSLANQGFGLSSKIIIIVFAFVFCFAILGASYLLVGGATVCAASDVSLGVLVSVTSQKSPSTPHYPVLTSLLSLCFSADLQVSPSS